MNIENIKYYNTKA